MNVKPSAYVIFGDGMRVGVEIAETEAVRARGLMFRGPLQDEEGMLFVFDRPGRYGFWMKNVRGPLDIIWLDEASRIVWIAESAPPCNTDPCPIYEPRADATFVIELAGGFVRRHHISVGDVVTISLRQSSSSRRAMRDRC